MVFVGFIFVFLVLINRDRLEKFVLLESSNLKPTKAFQSPSLKARAGMIVVELIVCSDWAIISFSK